MRFTPASPRRWAKFFTFLLASGSPMLLAQPAATAPVPATDNSPADWIDPDTGHRIIRLSAEPGSTTLYFHDNSYSPEGDKLVFNSPSGLAMVDLATLGSAPPDTKIVVPGGRSPYMARRTHDVYFQRGGGGRRGPRGANGQPPAQEAIGQPWHRADPEVLGVPAGLAAQGAAADAVASGPGRFMPSITTRSRPGLYLTRPAP